MFFLSDQQKYLLAVLHEIGCIRRAQAAVLLHRKFGSSPAAVTAILKQLKMLGKIREHDNVLSTIGESADTPILQAVDLVLAVFARDAPRRIYASLTIVSICAAKCGFHLDQTVRTV